MLKGRCDSFVVETHVEYPTDIGLLWDAMRKIIQLTARVSKAHDVSGWRQNEFNQIRIYAKYRKAQKSKRSRKQDAQKEIHKAHQRLINSADRYLIKSKASCDELRKIGEALSPSAWSKLQFKLDKIKEYQLHAERQIDQISRRVLKGEKIPHEEKVFSLFQPHTEWISKGKAGVPFELGVRVCILEDQYKFILHHRVMEKEEDVDVAVDMVKDSKKDFPNLAVCSFDTGFYSPSNKTNLSSELAHLVMPKKGKLSAADQSERDKNWKQTRRQHSAVESAINALEQTGLDKCRDHGIDGFKRYVGFAILSRNLKRLGSILTDKEREQLKRKQRARPILQAV